MALTGIDYILANGKDLIPHIEEMALKYVFHQYSMASRVRVFNDMQGWNTRKISEYVPSRRAVELDEDTAIPDTTLLRVRKSEIAPKEVGDRYRISDRRASTDLESIVTDTIEALGRAIGDRVESDLFATALSTFVGGTIGDGTADYSLLLPQQASSLFRQRRSRVGQLYHVVHSYQIQPIIQTLLTFTNAQDGQYALQNFNNSAIQELTLPIIGNIAVADFLPRRVIWKLALYGTGGTFRLQVGDGNTVGEHITSAITASATPATLITNVKSALEALTFTGNGTWTVSGSAVDNMTITPPTTLFLDDFSQLRVAVKYDGDATLDGGLLTGVPLQKSAYDLVTGITGAPTDSLGASLGVVLYERSATAKSLVFYRDALAYDLRSPVKAHFETVYQGRTAEYSAYQVYGVDGWSPELGMFIHTKANSPIAVG